MKLSDAIDEYVAHKRALGMEFTTEARLLRAFCRYTGNLSVDTVTTDQLQNYLDGDTPISSFWQRKHTALSGLYRFMLSRGYIKQSPLPCRHPKLPPPLVPYIYSHAELKCLLAATPAACGPQVPMETYVFRTLILLLYGACLRIGEALRLTMSAVDLDQNVLHVRETKFYKSRLVPLGRDLSRVLRQYVKQRNIRHGREADSPLFCFRDGRSLSQSAARSAFKRTCILTGIQRHDGGRYQPRLHDLRHTGVVHRLIAWYRSEADLQFLLPQLATYLGHINLSATQRYLTLTPELLHEASLRFEHYTKEAPHE